MPTLRKIVATPNTERPTYQKNIGSGQVERGVHQRIGVGVELPTNVGEVDRLVVTQELTGASLQRAQVLLLHLPPSRDLFDHELRVASHLHRARGRGGGRLEPGDERAVLGDVVGGLADAL